MKLDNYVFCIKISCKESIINKLLVIAIATFGFNTLVHAGGSNSVAPSHLTQSKFSGLFVGVGLSNSQVSADIRHKKTTDTSLGYHVGISKRIHINDNWIVGVEGSIGDITGDLSRDDSKYKLSHNWHWSLLAGRVIGANRDQLIYATFGVSGMRVKGASPRVSRDNHNYKGARAALGYERAITNSLNLSTEVSYVSFDEDIDFVKKEARVSVLYRF